MNLLLLCAVAGSITTIIGFILLRKLSGFNDRTIYDVPEVLRQIDEALVQRVFDIEAETATRQVRGPYYFRREQRYRFDLAAALYGELYTNVCKLLQWLNTEAPAIRKLKTEDEYGPEALEQMEIGRREGARFCRYALCIIVKTRMLGLLMFLDRFCLLRTPSVAALLKFGNVDLLELYQEIRKAVTEFAMVYGEEQSKLIESGLWKPI